MTKRTRLRSPWETRRLLGWVLAVAVGLGLAACGDDTSTTTTGKAPAPTATGSGATGTGTADSGSGGTGTTRAPDAAKPIDPNDPAAFAALGTQYEVEVAPFVAPVPHRGAGDSKTLLLWPQKDVRLEGLVSYSIEVDEGYGDELATLEFRKGSTTLWRASAPFDPKNLTTTGLIPAEVQQGVKVGDTVTWGLFFDKKSRRKDVKTEFKIVREPKAEKKIERIRSDKAMNRELPMTRELLVGKTLENYRLYSESLVYHLSIYQAYPDSVLPLQGLVTAMQRLDLKDSTLWSVISPALSGAGRRTGAASELATAAEGSSRMGGGGTGGGGAGLLSASDARTVGLYMPPTATKESLAMTDDKPAGATKPLGPGGAVPPGLRGDGSGNHTDPAAPAAGTTDAPAGDTATPPGRTSPEMRKQFEALQNRSAQADAAAARAHDASKLADQRTIDAGGSVQGTTQQLEQAEKTLLDAEAAAATPTGDQAKDEANRKALEEARAGVDAAQRALLDAQSGLLDAQDEARKKHEEEIAALERRNQEKAALDRMRAILEGRQLPGTLPVGPTVPGAPLPPADGSAPPPAPTGDPHVPGAPLPAADGSTPPPVPTGDPHVPGAPLPPVDPHHPSPPPPGTVAPPANPANAAYTQSLTNAHTQVNEATRKANELGAKADEAQKAADAAEAQATASGTAADRQAADLAVEVALAAAKAASDAAALVLSLQATLEDLLAHPPAR